MSTTSGALRRRRPRRHRPAPWLWMRADSSSMIKPPPDYCLKTQQRHSPVLLTSELYRRATRNPGLSLDNQRAWACLDFTGAKRLAADNAAVGAYLAGRKNEEQPLPDRAHSFATGAVEFRCREFLKLLLRHCISSALFTGIQQVRPSASSTWYQSGLCSTTSNSVPA